MLSASGDCPPKPLTKSFAEGKWEMVKKSFRNLYWYMFKMSSSPGDFVPLNPSPGALPLGPMHWGKLPEHFTGSLASLLKFFQVILYRSSHHSGPPLQPYLQKNINGHFKIFFIHCIWCLGWAACPCFLCRDAASFQKESTIYSIKPTLDSLHRPSKWEFITVSCRPPNAFQLSAYNQLILAFSLGSC